MLSAVGRFSAHRVSPLATSLYGNQWKAAITALSVVVFSCASVRGEDWQSGTLLPGSQRQDSAQGNPCGYPPLDPRHWPYSHTASISPDNLLPYACGSCVVISSNISQFRAFAVQIIDYCRECGPNSFVLSNGVHPLLPVAHHGPIAIQYRQVACSPPGNMALEIEWSEVDGLIAHPLEVAGPGRITSMDVRTTGSGDGGWKGMSFMSPGSFNIYWEPIPPLDFRITPHAGQTLIALNVTGAPFQNGTFWTNVQAGRGGWPRGPAIDDSLAPSHQAMPLPILPASAPSAQTAPVPGPIEMDALPITPMLMPQGVSPEAQAPPAPSPEQIAESMHAAALAQNLLQRQNVSLDDAMALQLPLCVPVTIGQVSRCVTVAYDTGGPSPQPASYFVGGHDAEPGTSRMPGAAPDSGASGQQPVADIKASEAPVILQTPANGVIEGPTPLLAKLAMPALPASNQLELNAPLQGEEPASPPGLAVQSALTKAEVGELPPWVAHPEMAGTPLPAVREFSPAPAQSILSQLPIARSLYAGRPASDEKAPPEHSVLEELPITVADPPPPHDDAQSTAVGMAGDAPHQMLSEAELVLQSVPTTQPPSAEGLLQGPEAGPQAAESETESLHDPSIERTSLIPGPGPATSRHRKVSPVPAGSLISKLPIIAAPPADTSASPDQPSIPDPESAITPMSLTAGVAAGRLVSPLPANFSEVGAGQPDVAEPDAAPAIAPQMALQSASPLPSISSQRVVAGPDRLTEISPEVAGRLATQIPPNASELRGSHHEVVVPGLSPTAARLASLTPGHTGEGWQHETARPLPVPAVSPEVPGRAIPSTNFRAIQGGQREAAGPDSAPAIAPAVRRHTQKAAELPDAEAGQAEQLRGALSAAPRVGHVYSPSTTSGATEVQREEAVRGAHPPRRSEHARHESAGEGLQNESSLTRQSAHTPSEEPARFSHVQLPQDQSSADPRQLPISAASGLPPQRAQPRVEQTSRREGGGRLSKPAASPGRSFGPSPADAPTVAESLLTAPSGSLVSSLQSTLPSSVDNRAG